MAPICRLWWWCGAQKGDNGLCYPWCQTPQPPPACHWCPSSCLPGTWFQKEWVWVGESMCGFFKRKCLGLQKFLPPTQSQLVFASRICGDLTSWHWNPELRGLVWGWDSSLLWYPSQIFIHHMWCETSLFCVCALPTSLDGCGFNSIVVRLPFN